MIIADTSVWIEHLRRGDATFADLLNRGMVMAHAFVTGELALGHLRQRGEVLALLRNLPQSVKARDDEALSFIEANSLHGLGIGYVDVHLLASARLSGAHLWSHDKALNKLADYMGIAFPVASRS